MARVDLSVLMMKLTCDTNPRHRNQIVIDHMRRRLYEDVEYCFWDLVAAVPDQLDVFLTATGGKPSIPRIKKLMSHYYAHFKNSNYFDKKFLDYNCVAEVDPLRRIKAFCAEPTKKGREAMTQLFQYVDVRVERVVRQCLPEEYFSDCFGGPAATATIAFRDYDDQMIGVKQAQLGRRLSRWQGSILLQISMGKARALAWEGFSERAKTFRETKNSDVRGVCDLITSFVKPTRPRKPTGWYSFFLPKSFCEANYATIVEQDRKRAEMKLRRKAVRRIKTEDDVLRCAEEIKRRRGLA